MMQWKYAALAALVAGGAYVGVEAIRGGSEDLAAQTDAADPAQTGAADPTQAAATQAPIAAPPPDEAAPSEVELRLAAAEAERDSLRAALDAASAERDALSAAFAAQEAEAAAPANADAPDPAAEIERLLADLAGQAAEIDRLKAELAARDVELAALRATAKLLPGDPELISPTLVAEQPDGALPATTPALDRLDAAKAGQPAPRPTGGVEASPTGDAPLALVLFERGSSRLTLGAAERAQAAAAALAEMNAGQIRVTGHSDTTGSAAANMRLSRARAEAVAAALVEAGLPAERIEIEALGQAPDTLPILTGDGVPEPLNRSASIFAVTSIASAE